jgi:hypothetical protein
MFNDAVSPPELPEDPLTYSRRNWDRVREFRLPLADEVDRTARDLHAGFGPLLRRVACWLRGPADYVDALAQPMVLAMCLELIKSDQSQSEAGKKPPQQNHNASRTLDENGSVAPFTTEDLQKAVHAGVRSVLGRQVLNRWRTYSLLLYPLLTILFGWVFWVISCFIVFPSIQEIFQDFGMQLPRLTSFLLSSASVVQQSGGMMILIPIAYVALFLGLSHYGSNFRNDGESWLDQQLQGKRHTLANWCWHLALLLEWGLCTKTAILVAGMCSNRGWLQQQCLDWIGESGNRRLKGTSTATTDPSREFFSKPRFQLVNCAIKLEGLERILLLREISTYYQEQSAGFVEWLLVWCSTILLWLSFALILMILIAVYAPLFQLLGLLGGFW